MALNFHVVPICQRSRTFLSSVSSFFLESGNPQAILLCLFRLQNDLYFLRRHLVSLVCVRVVQEIIANDLELDLG